ncbi:MAG: YihY/virulence factor BrkB family protein [Myxococcales bacterium]|nr:YihY/virulence factor BrkB family protein [Myxococcales bacterium]
MNATLVRRILGFAGRVLADFRRHKGLLLAGGIAYNTLISLIPLLAVLLVVLTRIFDEEQIITIVRAELLLILPGEVDAVIGEIRGFLAQRDVIGGVGLVVLLFFASLAFRMLEDALAIIFEHRRIPGRRRLWFSALLPYIHILILGAALIALTTMVVVLDTIHNNGATFLGLPISELTSALLYVGGFAGHVLLFTLIYRLMPTIKVRFRRALVGGLTASVLWEIIRRVLTWYFTNLSMISVIYGSLATGVIVLFTFEIASVIILLGAQTIAELQHSADAGLPWYEAAPDEIAGPTEV